MRFSGPQYLSMRSRTLDRVVAVAAMIVLAPVLLVLVVVVAAIDGRPVFVSLERVGRHGERFRQLKLRTMTDGVGGATITSGADQRITDLGVVLRRHRIDELPQLVNIARGEMALIGPRPETPDMVDGTGDWPRVLQATPGLAGATQVVFARLEPLLLTGDDHGRVYREEVLPEKLRMDRWYVENASPVVDLQILWATLRAVSGDGGLPASLERRMPSVDHLVREAERGG